MGVEGYSVEIEITAEDQEEPVILKYLETEVCFSITEEFVATTTRE